MLLKMLGSHWLELTMPWLHGGPYTASPGAVFEVDDRDGITLLEGNDRLFERVDGPENGLVETPLRSGPAAEGEQADQPSVPPSAPPVEERSRRRKKGASEAAGKDA